MVLEPKKKKKRQESEDDRWATLQEQSMSSPCNGNHFSSYWHGVCVIRPTVINMLLLA